MMMNKKSLDTKIEKLWRRYVAGDVVVYARDNSSDFPHSFMEIFANRFLANLHLHPDVAGEESKDLAQRLMFRLSKNFTHEEPAAHMAYFKTLVKETVPADEEAAASRARKAATKDAETAKFKAMEAAKSLSRAMSYLKNTGITARASKVPSKHWYP